MTEIEKSTEQQILEAAKKVFLEKGFDGARMQHIADEAGMNKALLHYYFRSKEKLFEAIFENAFRQFLPNIAQLMMSDLPFSEKIRGFVSHYIDTLIANPHLPAFIVHEIHRDPGKVVEMMRKSGIDPQFTAKLLQREIDDGKIYPIALPHLVVNLIAMCVFPFIGRPILQGFIFNNNSDAFDNFLEERKNHISEFILRAIVINPNQL